MINTDRRYRRIRWVAQILRWIAIATMCVVAVTAAYPFVSHVRVWTVLPWLIADLQHVVDLNADALLTQWLHLVPSAVLLYGFYRLVKMMQEWERGAPFSPQVPAHLQSFSLAIVVAKLLYISVPLQVAALHLMSGRRHPPIRLIVTSEQLSSLLLAVLFLIVASVLREAAIIAEDNASIV